MTRMSQVGQKCHIKPRKQRILKWFELFGMRTGFGSMRVEFTGYFQQVENEF